MYDVTLARRYAEAYLLANGEPPLGLEQVGNKLVLPVERAWPARTMSEGEAEVAISNLLSSAPCRLRAARPTSPCTAPSPRGRVQPSPSP